MDELYIRMCREATEIQESWEPKPGDRIMREWPDHPTILVRSRPTENDTYWVYTSTTEGDSGLMTVDDLIKRCTLWLPRQEDLQQIFRLKNGNPDDYWILKSFLVWFSDLNFCHYRDVSINKLWLRYVMEFVYKKRWNGTEWEPLP